MTSTAGHTTPGPFDPPAADQAEAPTHLVLAGARAERSLWPAHTEVPDGWTVLHGPAPYAECVAHIEGTAVAA